MGCVNSRVEEVETVWRCRERRRLMKRLLICRTELAADHMAYLQSLRNAGATLRQFAETESDVSGNSHPYVASPRSILPPPPPPPLPPSPPPPHFSIRKKVMEVGGRSSNDDVDSSIGIGIDDDDNESRIPPPLPIHSSTWNFLDPLGISSGSNYSSKAIPRKFDDMNMQAVEDEDKWGETITEFGVEDDEEERERKREYEGYGVDMPFISLKEKLHASETTDDCSSMVNRVTKESSTAVVTWRSKKTLLGILKDIDDYFLKAAAGGSDIIVFLESTHGQLLERNSKKTKGESHVISIYLIALAF